MYEPLEPEEFCAYWIPRLKNLEPDERNYRKICASLLSELTENTIKTCNNWLTPDPKLRCSLLIRKYLRVLDLLWQLESIVPHSLDFPEKTLHSNKSILSKEPDEFCSYWIPLLTPLQINEYGYRKASCSLLSELSGKNKKTCNNWLNKSKKHPIPNILKKYLYIIHLLWQIELILPFSIDNYLK